jgi:hypothetical protein
MKKNKLHKNCQKQALDTLTIIMARTYLCCCQAKKKTALLKGAKQQGF